MVKNHDSEAIGQVFEMIRFWNRSIEYPDTSIEHNCIASEQFPTQSI